MLSERRSCGRELFSLSSCLLLENVCQITATRWPCSLMDIAPFNAVDYTFSFNLTFTPPQIPDRRFLPHEKMRKNHHQKVEGLKSSTETGLHVPRRSGPGRKHTSLLLLLLLLYISIKFNTLVVVPVDCPKQLWYPMSS